MLNEKSKSRAITPAQIAPLVQWDKLEGCIILGMGKDNESNYLTMSSLTYNEVVLLQAQLAAHVTVMLMGTMVEGLPFEEIKEELPRAEN